MRQPHHMSYVIQILASHSKVRNGGLKSLGYIIRICSKIIYSGSSFQGPERRAKIFRGKTTRRWFLQEKHNAEREYLVKMLYLYMEGETQMRQPYHMSSSLLLLSLCASSFSLKANNFQLAIAAPIVTPLRLILFPYVTSVSKLKKEICSHFQF